MPISFEPLLDVMRQREQRRHLVTGDDHRATLCCHGEQYRGNVIVIDWRYATEWLVSQKTTRSPRERDGKFGASEFAAR